MECYYEDFKIAGSIDMIFINEDGTLSIYDWKRCKNIEKFNNFGKKCLVQHLKHISDTNYWHYTFQLNIYKFILESKYGFTVKDLHLVVIHLTIASKTMKKSSFLSFKMKFKHC